MVFYFFRRCSLNFFYWQLHPDNAIFYYDVHPVADKTHYNTWLGELKYKYPFFRTQILKASDKGCAKNKQPNVKFITAALTTMGGFYFSEHTIIANFSQNLRNLRFIDGYDVLNYTGFYMSAPGLPGQLTVEKIMQEKKYNTKFTKCMDKSAYLEANRISLCVNIPDLIFPKDIWELKNEFGKLARRVFYDTEEMIKPKQNFSELIPNIGHMVWIGRGSMDYLFYLSALSLLYVVKVDTLYIHGNGPPKGRYWDAIKNDSRVQTIYRDPGTIYGNRVKDVSHISDVWRADIMVRYGGIYSDVGKYVGLLYKISNMILVTFYMLTLFLDFQFVDWIRFWRVKDTVDDLEAHQSVFRFSGISTVQGNFIRTTCYPINMTKALLSFHT